MQNCRIGLFCDFETDIVRDTKQRHHNNSSKFQSDTAAAVVTSAEESRNARVHQPFQASSRMIARAPAAADANTAVRHFSKPVLCRAVYIDQTVGPRASLILVPPRSGLLRIDYLPLQGAKPNPPFMRSAHRAKAHHRGYRHAASSGCRAGAQSSPL